MHCFVVAFFFEKAKVLRDDAVIMQINFRTQQEQEQQRQQQQKKMVN